MAQRFPSSSAAGLSLGSLLDTGHEVALAPGYTAQQGKDRLEIRRNLSKSSGSFWILLPFFLVMAFGTALAALLTTQDPVFILYAVMGFFPSVVLGYNLAVGLISRTTIIADRTGLHGHTAPLPWLGDFDLSTSEVEEIFAKESLTTVDRVRLGEVYVRGRGRQQRVLVCRNLEDARAVSDRLNRHLGREKVPEGATTGADEAIHVR